MLLFLLPISVPRVMGATPMNYTGLTICHYPKRYIFYHNCLGSEVERSYLYLCPHMTQNMMNRIIYFHGTR